MASWPYSGGVHPRRTRSRVRAIRPGFAVAHEAGTFFCDETPFNNFSTDFLGRGSKALVNGVWVDVVPNPGATPGQEADAWVYFGNSLDVEAYVRPIR